MVKIEVSRGFSAIFSSEPAESLEVYILVLVVESAVVVAVRTPRGADRRDSDRENNNLRQVSVTERLQAESFVFPRVLGNWECWEPSALLSGFSSSVKNKERETDNLSQLNCLPFDSFS